MNNKCKICESGAREIFDEQYDQNYYYCPKCEFICLDESKIISPEQEKKEYDFHQNSFDNKGYVQMFRDFIDKAILPYKKRIKTALDYGSGPGPVLAELLKQQGFQTDIYDKHFAPDKVFERKKYDLITSTEVLEHLNDPLDTLKMLKNHLNNNGMIAIMTLFHQNNEDHFKQWWYRRDSTHISFYTIKTFKYMAELVNMKMLMNDDKNICVLAMNQYKYGSWLGVK